MWEAFEATRPADLEVWGLYKQWTVLAEHARMAIDSGHPAAESDSERSPDAGADDHQGPPGGIRHVRPDGTDSALALSSCLMHRASAGRQCVSLNDGTAEASVVTVPVCFIRFPYDHAADSNGLLPQRHPAYRTGFLPCLIPVDERTGS